MDANSTGSPKGKFWNAKRTVKVLLAIVGVGLLLSGTNHTYRQIFGIRRTVTSFMSANSPIAKMATREVVWRVMVAEDSLMKTSVQESVLKILAGYDLALVKPEDISYDLTARKVTIRLPTPIIMSVDDCMTKNVLVDKATVAGRLFAREKSSMLDVLARLVVDAERYGIFSAESIREGMDEFIGKFVQQNYGFEVTFASDNPLSPTDMIVAYLQDKGVEIDRAAFDKMVEDVRKGKDKDKKTR